MLIYSVKLFFTQYITEKEGDVTRKIILCIALSMDGFIADKNGAVDFLFEKPRKNPDTEYAAFYDQIDTILFGHVSFQQIVEEVSPDHWLYPDKNCIVFTRKQGLENTAVSFTHCSPKEWVSANQNQPGKDIWLFGGSDLINQFIQDDLIDAYLLYTMPVLLGEGVPLFRPPHKRFDLQCQWVTKNENDVIKAYYTRAR